MLFNSYIFILLFFPLVLVGYYGLNHFKQYKPAMLFLTGMSLWFCGYQNIYYLAVLLLSMVTNYLFYRLLTAGRAKGLTFSGKICLLTGILVNVGLLFVFKYYDFFISSFNTLVKTELPLLNLLLPLGISFYTFGQISFLTDAYRGECDGYTFLEYAAFVAFFPKLVQGPISYHSELIPQFRDENRKRINYEKLSAGLYAFALGLAKKVLVADTLAKMVNAGYGDIAGLNSPSAALVMLSYSLQIYFDFSGYCDMAGGMANMLNMELPLNFNSPYKATSISDFWDRWHMTLTRFFTKYIYIPLGGSRKGRLRTYFNVMLVFLISGLWHGDNWTFIIWGGLNGLAIVLEKLLKYQQWKLPKVGKGIAAFILTTFAWSIFRAPSMTDVWLLWQRTFTGGWGSISVTITDKFQDLIEASFLYRAGFGGIMSSYPGLFPCLFVGILIVACVTMKNTQQKVACKKLNAGRMLVTVGLLLWSILSLSEISEFLYSNF